MLKYFVAVLVILLTGCGGSGSPGSKDAISVSSGTDIRNALDKAGLSCTGYKPVAKNDRKWGTESAADVGECDLENENITLIIWKDRGQKENWIGVGKKTGCTLGNEEMPVRDFVDGGLWSVDGTSETLAKKIAAAIGGKATHVNCG